MTLDERETAIRELEAHRDWRFGLWIVITIQLVSEKYPEELRAAIGKAFDLSGYEAELKNLSRRYQKALHRIGELEKRLSEIGDEPVTYHEGEP